MITLFHKTYRNPGKGVFALLACDSAGMCFCFDASGDFGPERSSRTDSCRCVLGPSSSGTDRNASHFL